MSEYTKGPWHVWGGTELVVKAENRIVGSASQQSMADWETAKANTRLIATAPELLQVAMNFVEWFECGRIGDKPTADLEHAREVIAKAKGML